MTFGRRILRLFPLICISVFFMLPLSVKAADLNVPVTFSSSGTLSFDNMSARAPGAFSGMVDNKSFRFNLSDLSVIDYPDSVDDIDLDFTLSFSFKGRAVSSTVPNNVQYVRFLDYYMGVGSSFVVGGSSYPVVIDNPVINVTSASSSNSISSSSGSFTFHVTLPAGTDLSSASLVFSYASLFGTVSAVDGYNVGRVSISASLAFSLTGSYTFNGTVPPPEPLKSNKQYPFFTTDYQRLLFNNSQYLSIVKPSIVDSSSYSVSNSFSLPLSPDFISPSDAERVYVSLTFSVDSSLSLGSSSNISGADYEFHHFYVGISFKGSSVNYIPFIDDPRSPGYLVHLNNYGHGLNSSSSEFTVSGLFDVYPGMVLDSLVFYAKGNASFDASSASSSSNASVSLKGRHSIVFNAEKSFFVFTSSSEPVVTAIGDQTSEITTGYNSSSGDSAASDLNSSINDYNAVEDGIFDQLQFDIPQIDLGNDQPGILLAGSFLQALFSSNVWISRIVSFVLTFGFLLFIVGWLKKR